MVIHQAQRSRLHVTNPSFSGHSGACNASVAVGPYPVGNINTQTYGLEPGLDYVLNFVVPTGWYYEINGTNAGMSVVQTVAYGV